MKKIIAIAGALLLAALFAFVGCSGLKERTETRIIKDVIAFVDERDKSDETSVAKALSQTSAEQKTYYTEQSFQEQKNALFYCKMAVYMYESQTSLINDSVYIANNIGEEQSTLRLRLTNADGLLTMEALYGKETDETYVHLTVHYDAETETFNSYAVTEEERTGGKNIYFESRYDKNFGGNELLYSARCDETEYYIFESGTEGTVLASSGEEEKVIETVYGKKSAREHLADISERSGDLRQELADAEPEAFTFDYDGLMEYLTGTEYGHKGHSSSGENENIEFRVICYCENGRVIDFIGFAYQGKWEINPGFPEVGDTISDESGKDWVIEGFYWDAEYTQPIPVLEGLEYSGEEVITIYAKMYPVEE